MFPHMPVGPRLAALSLALAICLAVFAGPARAKAPALYTNPCPPEAVPAKAAVTSPVPRSLWAVCGERRAPGPRDDGFGEADTGILIVVLTGVVLAVAVGIVWPDVTSEETPPERPAHA
jgi:hypothetical protein